MFLRMVGEYRSEYNKNRPASFALSLSLSLCAVIKFIKECFKHMLNDAEICQNYLSGDKRVKFSNHGYWVSYLI